MWRHLFQIPGRRLPLFAPAGAHGHKLLWYLMLGSTVLQQKFLYKLSRHAFVTSPQNHACGELQFWRGAELDTVKTLKQFYAIN